MADFTVPSNQEIAVADDDSFFVDPYTVFVRERPPLLWTRQGKPPIEYSPKICFFVKSVVSVGLQRLPQFSPIFRRSANAVG